MRFLKLSYREQLFLVSEWLLVVATVGEGGGEGVPGNFGYLYAVED